MKLGVDTSVLAACIHAHHPVLEAYAEIDTILVFSYLRVMKNVTVTLSEDTAKWVRIWAAEQGKSVSAALSDLIDERRHDRERRERALDQFRSVPILMLGPAGQRYPSRESVHER
jgi:hypothetical protein